MAAGKLKDRQKIERKLGSLEARDPQVADLYAIKVVDLGGDLRLAWQRKPDRQSWQQTREGAYLLRTNLTETDPSKLWKSYIQLTEAEAVFRTLKSVLSIRPIFHQLERRRRGSTSWWLSSATRYG